MPLRLTIMLMFILFCQYPSCPLGPSSTTPAAPPVNAAKIMLPRNSSVSPNAGFTYSYCAYADVNGVYPLPSAVELTPFAAALDPFTPAAATRARLPPSAILAVAAAVASALDQSVAAVAATSVRAKFSSKSTPLSSSKGFAPPPRQATASTSARAYAS